MNTKQDAAAPPSADLQGGGTTSFALYAFLMGIAGIDGVHFGDKHPTLKGRYWWRHRLAQEYGATTPPPTAGSRPEDARDAARYRWLRDKLFIEASGTLNARYEGFPASGHRDGAKLDAAIDSRIEALTGKGETP